MSQDDTIKVVVDDSELDAALIKAQMVLALTNQAAGGGGAIGGATRGPGQKGLPGLNREMRLILNQIPGMREAIQVYFRLSRMVRGAQLGNFSLYVTLIATAIIVLKRIMEYQQELEQRQRQYEALVMKNRQVTREEAQNLIKQWESSARSRPG